MQKVELGRTGLRVAALGLGGIPITRLDVNAAADLIRYAFEQGITFFDTASLYADSETKIGRGLKGVRDQAVIATKTMAREEESVERELVNSLKCLQTDYIDLYQLHNISNQESLDAVLAPKGAYEAAVRAQRAGKIGHIGFSAHNVDMAAKICKTGLFATVQIPFNYVEYDPAEKLFPIAREHHMGMIAMKPIGGGILERPELCFRFLQQYSDVLPIPGMETQKEIDENLAHYLRPQKPRPEDQAQIEKFRAETGTRFCHRCEYCLPCPQGIPIWNVLLFKAQSKRFPRDLALGLAESAMKSVANCEQCGECEAKCPYDLPVPELLQESLDYYKRFCEEA